MADVLNVILDKGIVIDIYARVALVGIELLTVDVRIVIASVDTYLRFAEAVNRLDLTDVGNQKGLPDLLSDGTESVASSKTKGMITGAKDALFGGSGDDDDEEEKSSSRSSGSSSRSRSSSGSRSRGRS